MEPGLANLLHLILIFGVTLAALRAVGKSIADVRCRDVSSSLGSMVEIQFDMGLTPFTNKVKGIVKCATGTKGYPVDAIDLPIRFCPENMVFPGTDVVRDLVDHLCMPAGSPDRFREMILTDNLGNPAYISESDILKSLSWLVGDSGRDVGISAAYNKGDTNFDLHDPVWIPLKVAGLSRDKVIFVKPGLLVSVGLGSSPAVTPTVVRQLMGERARVSRTLTVSDGEVTYQVSEMRSAVDAKNRIRILSVAAYRDTEGCPICLESVGPLEPEICGHSFHPHCISTWKQKSSHASCPVCRSALAS